MPEAVSQVPLKINGFTLHRPRLAPLVVVLLVVTLLSLLFVWSRIHAINLEYRISSLEKEIRLHQRQNQELELEAAFLARDQRIEKLARNQLGLRDPAPGQIIRVE